MTTDAFSSVYSVDIRTGRYVALLKYPVYCGDVAEEGLWKDATAIYAEHAILEEDRQEFLELTDLGNIQKQLQGNNKIAYVEYRRFTEGIPLSWCRASVVITESDEAGMPVKFLLTMSDITAEKTQQEQMEELQRAKDMYNFSISGVDLFLWQLDLIKDEITFADNPFTVKRKKEIGYPDVVPNASKYIMLNVMPESVATMQRIFDDIHAGKEYTSGDIKFRAGGDEGYTICRLSYRTICDGDGRPVKAYGCEQNITDRVLLRDSYARELARFNATGDDVLMRTHVSLTQNRILEVVPLAQGTDIRNMTFDDLLATAIPKNAYTTGGKTLAEILQRGNAIASYANGERHLTIEYRWPGEAEWKWIRADIELAQNPENSDIELFMYCKDDTSSRMQTLIVENLSATIYDHLAVIDTADWSYIMQSADGVIDSNTVASYNDRVKELIENQVPAEEQDTALENFRFDRILNELETKNVYIVNTTEIQPDGSTGYKMRQFGWLERETGLLFVCVSDVTESTKAELAKQEENENFRRLYNAFVEGLNRIHDSELMIDIDGNAYYIYSQSKTFTPEPTGIYDDIYSQFCQSFPEDSEARTQFTELLTKDSLRTLLADDSLFETTYRRDFPDGSHKWFNFYMAAVLHEPGEPVRYVMMATTDVTDTITAQQELNERIESDAQILQQASIDAYDFIAVIDVPTETITLRSGSWFNINHPTPEEMRVLPYKALLDYIAKNYAIDEEQGKVFFNKFAIPSVIEELETQREVFFPFDFLDADDHKRIKYKQFRFSWLDKENGKIMASRSDVTTTMEKEKAINLQMKDALVAAEAANAAKSDFLSRMSHDIRTPMNAIIGFSTLLMQNAEDPDRVKDQSKKILTSSNHLLGLINDVLDMSKIETGKVQLNVRSFKLSETISVLDSIIRPQMEKKNQKFDIYISGVRHDTFVADNQRIQQILLNVLSNAMKYTGEGGHIALRIKGMPETSGKYETISFEVEDNGRGMTEEYQEIIFEPFSRELNDNYEQSQGTGLGMAITRNLVNMMGGTISVKSRVGEGSTFTVVLPLHLSDEEEDYAFWKTHSLTHMMVVDDEEEVCINVSETMEGTGVRMEYALDGATSVRRVTEAHEEGDDFDLVLLDWKMPGMDGIETARRMRSSLPDDVLIIILTAYDYSQIEEEALAAGVDGFMPKPFFMQEFEQTILGTGKVGKQAAADAPAADKKPADDALSGLHILAAEDNSLNAEILTEVLKANNATVDVAVNGREALETFRDAPVGKYDLVLMDVQMPVMDGYEATASIRALANEEGLAADKRAEAASVPIMAMTANAFSDDIQKALDSGMNAHIAKPLNIATLKEMVAKIVK